MQEHRVIERVLDASGRMLRVPNIDAEFMEKALDFFRNFADGCHHAKEEDVFFPALEQAGVPREGGPIGCMLREHDMGRRLIRAMADNLEEAQLGESAAADAVRSALRDYIVLLREHMNKEDNVLFVMAEHALDLEAQNSIRAEFGEAERSGLDPGKHERYLALADELSAWTFSDSTPGE